MILYHGTTVDALERILSDGLQPDQPQYRTDGFGRSGYVYLSRYYAPAYAVLGAESIGAKECVIIEVETEALDEAYFRPDEDDLAYQQCGPFAELEKIERVRREIDLEKYADQWGYALDRFGNIAHKGAISVDHLRRYARVTVWEGGRETSFASYVNTFGVNSKPAAEGVPSDIDQYSQLLRAYHGVVFDGTLPRDLDPSRADHYGYLMKQAGALGIPFPDKLQILFDERERHVRVAYLGPP